jgi:HD-like signal output (HDOD) protein
MTLQKPIRPAAACGAVVVSRRNQHRENWQAVEWQHGITAAAEVGAMVAETWSMPNE